MVSPELIRRYRYFSSVSNQQLNMLASIAEEVEFEPGHYFHNEGDKINNFYIVYEGDVSLVKTLPQQDKEVVINTIGTGDVFGWTSLLPPYTAGSGAKAVTKCKLIEFDSAKLLERFDADKEFGYLMMIKIAQVIRERLDAIVIETLAYHAEQ